MRKTGIEAIGLRWHYIIREILFMNLPTPSRRIHMSGQTKTTVGTVIFLAFMAGIFYFATTDPPAMA